MVDRSAPTNGKDPGDSRLTETSAERSAQMALVRSRNTKPELRTRRAFHAAGLRYRLHPRGVPGRPDIAFSTRRLAVFIHGCFWHRHLGCVLTRTPRSRVDFWERKFAENAARDLRVGQQLEAAGWTAFVIWECETKRPNRLKLLAAEIRELPAKARR
jgi:DNA mismatch endonuclease (patch repair protein)